MKSGSRTVEERSEGLAWRSAILWAAAVSPVGATFDSWNGGSDVILEGGCITIGEIRVPFRS
jgi:hypothetical protein